MFCFVCLFVLFAGSVLAVKRLMKEAAELRDPTDHYHAQPLEVSHTWDSLGLISTTNIPVLLIINIVCVLPYMFLTNQQTTPHKTHREGCSLASWTNH